MFLETCFFLEYNFGEDSNIFLRKKQIIVKKMMISRKETNMLFKNQVVINYGVYDVRSRLINRLQYLVIPRMFYQNK